ncbi:MAG TPA: TIGR01777 family oxidoreductase [Bryobacteraceae bacterium]|nr:TIGR01777 family oxidoreductase [Bryobacteraceae bacterium]
MNIAITGASGLIGTRLRQRLTEAGHTATPIPRGSDTALGEILASADAVIHLAGEPVAQRWNDEAKKRIHDSRVEGTRHLVKALSTQSTRPRVLVCASAVGYYGSRGDQILTEASSPGTDFLARVVVDWEEAAQSAESLGIREVRLRLGMVLGNGGALAKLLPPFRFGVGGRLGSGHQWMAWIHLEDAVNLILFALNYAAIRGAVNATAPHPVTNEEFTDRLAQAVHRPAILPVPAFALKLALGEMAEMVLASQRVLPTVAKSAGFRFQYPELHPALENLLSAAT